MPNDQRTRPLDKLDATYCATSATAAAMLLIGVLIRDVALLTWIPGWVVPLASFSILTLFALGVGLQVIRRRLLRPLPVLGCLLASGAFSAMAIIEFATAMMEFRTY